MNKELLLPYFSSYFPRDISLGPSLTVKVDLGEKTASVIESLKFHPDFLDVHFVDADDETKADLILIDDTKNPAEHAEMVMVGIDDDIPAKIRSFFRLSASRRYETEGALWMTMYLLLHDEAKRALALFAQVLPEEIARIAKRKQGHLTGFKIAGSLYKARRYSAMHLIALLMGDDDNALAEGILFHYKTLRIGYREKEAQDFFDIVKRLSFPKVISSLYLYLLKAEQDIDLEDMEDLFEEARSYLGENPKAYELATVDAIRACHGIHLYLHGKEEEADSLAEELYPRYIKGDLPIEGRSHFHKELSFDDPVYDGIIDLMMLLGKYHARKGFPTSNAAYYEWNAQIFYYGSFFLADSESNKRAEEYFIRMALFGALNGYSLKKEDLTGNKETQKFYKEFEELAGLCPERYALERYRLYCCRAKEEPEYYAKHFGMAVDALSEGEARFPGRFKAELSRAKERFTSEEEIRANRFFELLRAARDKESGFDEFFGLADEVSQTAPETFLLSEFIDAATHLFQKQLPRRSFLFQTIRILLRFQKEQETLVKNSIAQLAQIGLELYNKFESDVEALKLALSYTLK